MGLMELRAVSRVGARNSSPHRLAPANQLLTCEVLEEFITGDDPNGPAWLISPLGRTSIICRLFVVEEHKVQE